MPKSYRIRTQVGVDKAVKVNLEQDFESINILSLKILQSDIYNRQCSDYGVVVGRVFVNGGFGLPNARVSVFIPLSEEDSLNPVISELYPYTTISDVSEDGYRYNLLPKEPSYEGHAATGTFPTKDEVLLDPSYIEVYDKYYKFTTRTNDSGDYMIFGVPLGTQTFFLDVDLSDIGCFSLAPQDLIQAGVATESQVDGAGFKTSNSLSELPQIKTLNKIVDIAPLWGEPEICQLGITRVDFDLTSEANVRIEPKAIFMGSIVSTTEDDMVRARSCKPKNNTGNLCELVAGPGQILSIRQTINTDNEGFPILEQHKLEEDGKLIDGDGSYLVNLPMNLDYVYTNEFGEQTFSSDPTVGIPTKGRYRFKFKWENEGGLQNEVQRANFFVPNIKEHGWETSDYDDDPLKQAPVTQPTISFITQPLILTTFANIPFAGDLINPVLTNVDSFQVYISQQALPTNFQPYLGDANTAITGLTAGNIVQIVFTPTDPTLNSSIFYTGANGAQNELFQIVGQPVGSTYTTPNSIGLVFSEVINTSSYTIFINGNQYFGDTQVISLNAGDTIEVIPVFTDPLQLSTIIYDIYDENYFNLLKSYSFSLDWDDYADPQAAIDCEDSFYEFHYNKVYTTSMFLDRYKNGFGRARHLGIKEIDNRTCKSTTNTFPVNDVIRNFDFLFFVFNLLINILSIPLLVILFVAHLIAFLWPVLKLVLIVLGIFLIRNAIIECYQNIQSSIQILNEAAGTVSSGVGFVVNVTNILEIIRLTAVIVFQALQCAFQVALAGLFTAGAAIAALRVNDFPRIGLPMLAYPDCTTCDCDCGVAELGDNFDSDSILQQVESDAANSEGQLGGAPVSASTSTSFLAPINNVNVYDIIHPNAEQQTPESDPTEENEGNYWCNSSNQYPSFTWALGEGCIKSSVLISATLGYNRLISGSESLDIEDNYGGIPDKTGLHAPQPFLFAASCTNGTNGNGSRRFLAYPQTETFSQKLNEFNYREKYFEGVNRVGVTFNSPQNTGVHFDQPLIIMAKPGTLQQLGIGEVFSFQDPKLSDCNQNLTGVTFYNSITANTTNQFGNNAVTGTSFATTNITVNYANTTNKNTNLSVQYIINNTGNTENFLRNVIDIEYFQVITGFTYTEFVNNPQYTTSFSQRFPNKYLNHSTVFIYKNECEALTNSNADIEFYQIPNSITTISGHESYEILILARGVDPHSGKHTNKYDLSRIFGQSSNNLVVVEGQYYLNIPIQGYTNGDKPKSHNFSNNTTAPNLYFPAYNFTISPSYNVGSVTYNQFTPFTSNLPYYYLCPDDTTVPNIGNYTPGSGFPTISSLGTTGTYVMNSANPLRNRFLPFTSPYDTLLPNNSTDNYYFAGGSFTASPFNPNTSSFGFYNGFTFSDNDFSNFDEIYWPVASGPSPLITPYAVYSPAYYRYNLSQIQFPNPTLNPTQYLVMRSDRIPTSTNVENGLGTTGFGLHQNNNFAYYRGGVSSVPTIGFAPDINQGQTVFDESEFVQNLTSTLNCDNMVALECYTGSGTNIGVDNNCVIPPNRVKRGCYCLLNYRENGGIIDKLYLVEYGADARLFLEWKARFTMTFAACRGVFAQVFQNNWINGVLYMFSFGKNNLYELDAPDEPIYEYCKDIVVYNKITNGFYYRSSPWDGTDFIGVESPPKNSSLINNYPKYGYNEKRIQFPTTVMDLGPRDKFINQICNDSEFTGYIADQIRSTSYKDNSDIIQMGFISRLLNQRVIQRLLPAFDTGDGSTEGKGIIQFFDSTREGERIDGDFAQALSINSEWRVTPYIEENYPNNFLYIGNDATPDQNPVFGIFFSSSTEELQYRRRMTPGSDTYTNNGCTVIDFYGHSTDQIVPHYKWQIASPAASIFGTENNNWVTTSNQNATGTGFYTQYYQNLNFNRVNEYYLTSTTDYGFITNFDLNGDPLISNANTINGIPDDKPIVVGAPFFFYFGLNNGKTAVDKFIKLYVRTEE
jgi:hypothetical protein